MITVPVTITERNAKVLGQWASVGRTLDGIEHLLLEGNWDSEDDKERASNALDELSELHIPLENLHLSWRDQYWHRNIVVEEDVEKLPIEFGGKKSSIKKTMPEIKKQ